MVAVVRARDRRGQRASPARWRRCWRQADALALPFGDAWFDVVCCQFGAMFFRDRFAGRAEARRVIKPGGRFVFNVRDRIEENEFSDEVTCALAPLFPDDPPRLVARTPHGYHDTALIREELPLAGFADIELTTREDVRRTPSATQAAEAIASRQSDGPVSGKIQALVIVARRWCGAGWARARVALEWTPTEGDWPGADHPGLLE